jgi:hypothetical protein
MEALEFFEVSTILAEILHELLANLLKAQHQVVTGVTI